MHACSDQIDGIWLPGGCCTPAADISASHIAGIDWSWAGWNHWSRQVSSDKTFIMPPKNNVFATNEASTSNLAEMWMQANKSLPAETLKRCLIPATQLPTLLSATTRVSTPTSGIQCNSSILWMTKIFFWGGGDPISTIFLNHSSLSIMLLLTTCFHIFAAWTVLSEVNYILPVSQWVFSRVRKCCGRISLVFSSPLCLFTVWAA